MKKTIIAIKESLEKYGFRQKRGFPYFFYDCGWYFIFAELLKVENDIFIINGIQFLWHYDDFAVIREETKDDLNYRITEFTQTAIENACNWINSKKEYFLNTYRNPKEMLLYLKRYNDMSHQPHGYILARLLKNRAEAKFFEKSTKDRLKEINSSPGNYFPYSNEEKFWEIEEDITKLIGLDDRKFTEELNKRIGRSRMELKLKANTFMF